MSYARIAGLSLLLPALAACSGIRPSASSNPTSNRAELKALDVASLAEQVSPTVVNITSTHTADGPFGPVEGRALGTGFIVDSKGLIVTNAHVVEGATDLHVRFADGVERDATIKGRDRDLDLAVLSVSEGAPYPSVSLGSSEALRVGQPVIAVGNPFGLDHTVTTGIISAKGRSIGAGPYDDYLQTDASINPGNSGGPLFDSSGRVVGINTAINPEGRGIGFAIPVDALKEVLPQLVQTGHVTRGRLGASFQDVDATLAKALGLDAARGALITGVEAGGPAARSGLETGDVILSVNGKKVAHGADLPRTIAHFAPNTEVSLELLRNHAVKIITAKLDARRESAVTETATPRFKGRLGVALEDTARGVVIAAVAPQSPASRAELRPGDLIVELDGKKVTDAATLVASVANVPEHKAVVARVVRGTTTRFVGIELA